MALPELLMLQREGAAAFVKSWEELLACIGKKSATLRKAG